jgi:hypothetical protein
VENRRLVIRPVQAGCGAIPPQFSRSKCGGFEAADPSRPQDLFKFDPAREGSKGQRQNTRRASLGGRRIGTKGGDFARQRGRAPLRIGDRRGWGGQSEGGPFTDHRRAGRGGGGWRARRRPSRSSHLPGDSPRTRGRRSRQSRQASSPRSRGGWRGVEGSEMGARRNPYCPPW